MILKQVAEEINSNIKLEIDTPSQHNDGRLPVLDLKMWVNKEDNRIYHTFYEKNMQ